MTITLLVSRFPALPLFMRNFSLSTLLLEGVSLFQESQELQEPWLFFSILTLFEDLTYQKTFVHEI